jgi:multiple sugar transport system substrate-binding protein
MSRLHIIRSRIFLVSLLFAAALTPTACTRNSEPLKPLTLRLAGDGWFLKSLVSTGLITGYEHEAGVHIEIVDRNDRSIMSDLDRGPTPGNAPYDIVVMRHRWIGALVQKKQLRPIDPSWNDVTLHNAGFKLQQQLFPTWWRELSWYGDKVYGYPYTGLTAYLCYREDLLAEPENRRKFKARYHRDLVVPANWRDYTQVAEFFNRPAEHFYGTYISGKQGPALWYEWLNFIYSFGGDVLDTQHGWEYGDIIVNSPQNVAATAQYVKLIALSPPDTLNYGWNEAQTALQEGHTFMGLLWSDQAYLLESQPGSRFAGKFGYSPIPANTFKSASQLEGLTYLLPAQSQHSKEAYQFLEWVMSSAVQARQTLQGSSSINQSVYRDAAVLQKPYMQAFLDSLPVAKPKPTIPEASQMTDAAEQRLSAIVAGKESPQSGLDKLALDLKNILGNKGRLRYPVHSHN